METQLDEATPAIQRTTLSIQRTTWHLQRAVRDLAPCVELVRANNAALGELRDELAGLFGVERAALRLVTD
jgi:hypothetical protein